MTRPVGEYLRHDEADARAVGVLRAYWSGVGPQDPEQRATVRPRDLRFVSASGQIVATPWHHLVADLLMGRLSPELAPCVRAIAPREVRSLHQSEVRWGDLDAREWRALRVHGLTADVEASLLDPQDAEALQDAPPRPVGRSPVDRLTLLPAVHAALASWPADDPEGRALATSLRDHLRRDALERVEGQSWRSRAATLGVSLATVQRWYAPGGCLAP